MNDSELYHHGVKGMKWGHLKAQKYANKAKLSRESSKEWDTMAKYALEKGKTKKKQLSIRNTQKRNVPRHLGMKKRRLDKIKRSRQKIK